MHGAKPLVGWNKLAANTTNTAGTAAASSSSRRGAAEEYEDNNPMDDLPGDVEEDVLQNIEVATVGENLIGEWRMRNLSAMEGWECILDGLAQGYKQSVSYMSKCPCEFKRAVRLVDHFSD